MKQYSGSDLKIFQKWIAVYNIDKTMDYIQTPFNDTAFNFLNKNRGKFVVLLFTSDKVDLYKENAKIFDKTLNYFESISEVLEYLESNSFDIKYFEKTRKLEYPLDPIKADLYYDRLEGLLGALITALLYGIYFGYNLNNELYDVLLFALIFTPFGTIFGKWWGQKVYNLYAAYLYKRRVE